MNKDFVNFIISRTAIEKYFPNSISGATDNEPAPGSVYFSKLLTAKVNSTIDPINNKDSLISSGEVYSVGLINKINSLIINRYFERSGVYSIIDEAMTNNLGKENFTKLLNSFRAQFPGHNPFLRIDESELPNLETDQETISRIITIWLSNHNPAFKKYWEFVSDTVISDQNLYKDGIEVLFETLNTTPRFNQSQISLLDFLQSPQKAEPDSIYGQLSYIKNHWSDLIGDYLYRVFLGLDFIQEETKKTFFGPGEIIAPSYDLSFDLEEENFSEDKDWMPDLVLIAKNIYVWLDQLRRKYNLPIFKLDQIPDQALMELSERGLNGLWLIGVWERSEASAKIKNLYGNPEAIASAYSLYRYQISDDLGGEEALNNLKTRAWKFGIRLAADMVPNHMGIDSEWVHNHPDWFIQTGQSPFPAYQFTGEDLSSDPYIEIKIEDHYFDQSDSAVVFFFRDKRTNQIRYIYHGNDGTSMPWNDTAQLNYLIPIVREEVYQTILSVARRFPIIRFDAAMTLTNKHIQRLWFPEPGSGGAIPSRAEHSLTKDAFEKLLPYEFWRNVVDRIAVDAPDTLLLAEAFWLMEGYFVRTLGMHRVYNSAFMNMLRNEDNKEFKKLLINTIDFDPQILKRFVNFMNNPDEDTAESQFGKGDKYFGVCTLMCTLPGLPMFGHGQMEGFKEKYGMEYKRAYMDETEDTDLILRHLRQITPLLKMRNLFSDSENFTLFDFITTDLSNCDDVFVFTNYSMGSSSLVVYNNQFKSVSGTVRISTAIKSEGNNQSSTSRVKYISEKLRLDPNKEFVLVDDVSSGLTYIWKTDDIIRNGLMLTLNGYQFHVFINFRQVEDDFSSTYRNLFDYLNGIGVADIQQAITEMRLQPIHFPLKQILNRRFFDELLSYRLSASKRSIPTRFLNDVYEKIDHFLNVVVQFERTNFQDLPRKQELINTLKFILTIPALDRWIVGIKDRKLIAFMDWFQKPFLSGDETWITTMASYFISSVQYIFFAGELNMTARSWFEERRISTLLTSLANEYHYDNDQTRSLIDNTRFISGTSDWFSKNGTQDNLSLLSQLLKREDVQAFIGANEYQGKVYFIEEKMDMFIRLLFTQAVIYFGSNIHLSCNEFIEYLFKLSSFYAFVNERVENSKYLVDQLTVM